MRRQLTALVAASTSLILIALLVPIALLLRSGAEQRAISAASLQAQQVAVADGYVGGDVQIAVGSTSVIDADGTVYGVSVPIDAAVRLARTGRAFVARTRGGVEVLAPYQRPYGATTVVRVFVSNAQLHRGVVRAWILLAALGLALFVLALILADRLGRSLTRPVIALAATADRLAAGDLAARAVPDGPAEVREVGAELNRLADRIAELLAAAREEAADLAHQLRTPLTALRLDAEGLRDPVDAARLAAGVRALSERIDEVIRTARRPVREGLRADADLVAVVAARVGFWAVLAEDVGRPLAVVLPDGPVRVRVSAEDLATAVDVLLDNALTHTPDGAAVRLTVRAEAEVEAGVEGEGGGTSGAVVGGERVGGVCVVEDAGPGFSDDGEVERGRSKTGSTGLGVDIARRTAEAGGGGLRIGRSEDLGGALVELRFGPPVGR